MGFLKNFSEPFAFALALWPALLYHRDNRIRLSSAIVAYGTVLYLLGLLCFTLYPMPADAAAYCAAHHLTPQLNPLQFIGDIRTDGLTAVLQIAFNIVFFLPLGFIMGRIWRRSPVEHDRRADRIRAGHAFAALDSGAGR